MSTTTYLRAGWLTSGSSALLLGGALRVALEDLGGAPRYLLGGLALYALGAGLGLVLGGRDHRAVPLVSLLAGLGLVCAGGRLGEAAPAVAAALLGFGCARLRVHSAPSVVDRLVFVLLLPLGWLVPLLGLAAVIPAVAGLMRSKEESVLTEPTPTGSLHASLGLALVAAAGTGALVAVRGTLDPTPAGMLVPVLAALAVATLASLFRTRPHRASALAAFVVPASLMLLAAIPHRSRLWLLPLAGVEDPRLVALLMSSALVLPAGLLGGLAWRSVGPRRVARGAALIALGTGALLGLDTGPALRDQLLLALFALSAATLIRAARWGDKGLALVAGAAAGAVLLTPLPWPEIEFTRGRIYLLRTSDAPGQEQQLIDLLQPAAAAWGPDGSSLVETRDGAFERVLVDGLDHRYGTRAHRSAGLAGHLAAALAAERQRGAVLGEVLGGATSALVNQQVGRVDVVAPDGDLILALHETDESTTRPYLHPSVRLVPEATEIYLATSEPLDFIVELSATTWVDAHQGLPGKRQLDRRARALTPEGVYVLVLPLSWMDAEDLGGVLAQAEDSFEEVRLFLPPEGTDQLLLVAWPAAAEVPFERLVEAWDRARPQLAALSVASPVDLADRSLIDPEGVASLAAIGRPATRWHLGPAIAQRPQLHASALRAHVAPPTWYLGLDPEVESALALRAETNGCLLDVLASSSTGDVPGMFEGGRCLDERALDPLIAPHLERARQAIETAQREGPNSLEWRTCLTQTRAALWLHPRSAEAHALAGRCGLVVDRRAAKEDFEAALEIDPDHLDALLGLAQLQVAREQTEEALATLSHAVQAHPLAWRPHHHRGALLMGMGRPEEALEDLGKARGLAGEASSLPSSAMAEAYLQLGRTLDANFYAKAAAQRDPSAKNLDLLGRSYFELGQVKAAESEYRRAILADPNYWRAHAGLGLARARQGDFEGARSSLERVLELDPGNAQARQLLETVRALEEPAP